MGGGACSLVAIGVLGPLRVEVDGTEVTVSAARERALLARLAIDAGRTVPDAQLIDAVWGDDPPATARPTLQTYVSHLRRVLGPHVIARDGTGYRLDGVEIDTDAFTDEVSAARAAADTTVRLATFRRALGLWRGGALADLNGDATSAGLRARLEEDRLLVTEDLLETTIATEGPARAVPALEELCTRHPLRERAAALLMTALYRAGRQADALATYRRLRRALVEELGIEPSHALRDLEQRILEQDATLLDGGGSASRSATPQPGAEPAATMPLPPRLAAGRADAPLVGRRAELDQLLWHVTAAESDSEPPVLLRGEAGIGKTRLAREMALAASGRGWLVTWGRCPPDAGGAFQPFAEALDHLLRWRPELATGYESLLGSILPGLAARAGDPLALLRTGAEQRFAVLDALTDLAARAAQLAPLLIVIDDVHWGDAGTFALVEHLAARRPARVLLVATARAPEPTESPHFIHLIERLHRDHQLATIELHGLSEPEVRALVDRTTAQPAPSDAVSALHHQTGGNPFFVCEVLAALGDDGVRDLAGDLPLTAGVQSVLAQRLDHLSTDDQAVLAAAATLGADFDLASCAACAEVDDTTALGALERAAAMALVEESGPGSFAFSHALVQAAVMNRTPRTRRARLEERATSLDAARTMAEPGAIGRRVASRLLADAASVEASARPLDERDPRLASSRATLLRIAAGVSPLMSSPGVEEVVASSLTDERAGRTVLRWARSMILRGDAGLALARALETGELARLLPSASLLVDAALVGAEATGLLAGRVALPVGADVRRLLSDALKALDRDASAEAGVQHAQLLVHLAIASDDQANRGLLSVAARAAATRAGSMRWEAEALLAARGALWGPGSAAERVERDMESVALAEGLGDDELLGRTLAALARDQIAANTTTEAMTTLDRLLAIPNLRPDAIGRARLQQASLALLAGDSATAGETIEWAAAGGHARSTVDPFDPLATLLLVHAVHQGQLADARSSLFDAAERWPESLLWIGARAAAESDAGGREIAVAILEAARPLFERGPSSCGDVAGMTLMLRAAAAERHPSERALRRQLQRHGSELAVAGEVGVLGLVDELLATAPPT